MTNSSPKSHSEIVFREIGILTNKTIEYNKLIKEAKTKAKVDYFYKKMVKNNKKIEILLHLAQRLEAQEAAARAKPVEEPKVTEPFQSVPTPAA